MRFAEPIFLWLLFPAVAGLVCFFWWSRRSREGLLGRFVHSRLLPSLITGVSTGRRRLREILVTAAAALLIVALARPQWGFSWQEVTQRGLDIVVAIDTSRSMMAKDIAPDRLARAKLAALDLMQLAKSDRLGLVAFAGSAFLQCPLTIDDSAFRQSVELLDTRIIQEGGTAIAEAIRAAQTAYREGENFRVLVIMSDGEDHVPGAIDAAAEAADQGMRIFTIGIGDPEGEILQVPGEKGGIEYVRDEKGDVVKSRLNESLLQQVATVGNGFYLPMRGASTMDTLYEKGLAPLPKTESKEKLVQRFHERYHWPLGLAILLLIAEILLPERSRGRAAVSPPALIVLFFAFASLSAYGSAAKAQRDYSKGEFESALQEYKELMQQDKKGDPRLPFNAGAAAYRAGQYNEAARLFGLATSAPDLELQEKAYYNRGNALFQSGEQDTNPASRQKKWEQAVKDYSASLKLDPADADSQHNYEYVKQKLEEFKEQQQQQQNQEQDQNQDQQDQQQQNQQAPPQQQRDPQDQQQSQSQPQGEQQNSSPEGNQPEKPEESQQQHSPSRGDEDQQRPDEKPTDPAPSPANEERDKREEQGASPQKPTDGMTPEQAARFLDGQEEETRLMPLRKAAPSDRKVLKDW